MGKRNYTTVEYNLATQELRFEIRVEKVKGVGDTVGYGHVAPVNEQFLTFCRYWVTAPRPGW
jgi:hypothetical protein